MYEKKYLKYKQKYLNIKYGGASGEDVLHIPSIKIINITGETIAEFPIEDFTIETLITSTELDFYNFAFDLIHDDIIYSDNDNYEINKERIIKFVSRIGIKSCILTIVIHGNLYTDGPQVILPLINTDESNKEPSEIPNIITFDAGELQINLDNIPNLEKLNYINLSNYTHSTIKKILTMHHTLKLNLFKIILPNNSYIEEISPEFFTFSKKLKTINFNNLSNLKIIEEGFLYDSDIEKLDLENCINLIEIKTEFMAICKNLKFIKLPISIQKIEQYFLSFIEMPILDLENCINLTIITAEFCYKSILNSIKLPHSIQKIEEGFLTDSKIETVDLSNCINLIEIEKDFAKESKIKFLKLPVSIKKIGANFLLNSEIETLDLENCTNLELSDIPIDFLKNCKNLKTVKLPPKLFHLRFQHILSILSQGN